MVPLPPALARLVQERSGVELAAEVARILDGGRRRVTLGLGPGVDVPLLDEELHAAEVATIDRRLVVAAIRAEPDGYVVERGDTNFGVYVCAADAVVWRSVPATAELRGLAAGDEVGLGSTPADAVRFRLPPCALVPPPAPRRTARQQRAAEQVRAPTPTPAPTRARPTRPRAGRRLPSLYPSDRYQRRFDAAVRHWRYAMIPFGGDAHAVVHLDDPALAALRAALGRDLDDPDRGYELFVKDPSPDLWVQPAGERQRPLRRGDVVKLRGLGDRLGFGAYVVEVPAPVVPTPRFAPRHEPTPAEIAEVLGMDERELRDGERVRDRWRELVRRLHPDRHDGDPGHVSRFLEIQFVLDAWKRRS